MTMIDYHVGKKDGQESVFKAALGLSVLEPRVEIGRFNIAVEQTAGFVFNIPQFQKKKPEFKIEWISKR